jgi:hypothetical protein
MFLSLSFYRLLSLYFYMLTDVVSHVAFVMLYKYNMSNMVLSLSFYRLLSLYFYMLTDVVSHVAFVILYKHNMCFGFFFITLSCFVA